MKFFGLIILCCASLATEGRQISRRIDPEDYSFVVSLQLYKQHICGGALISQFHVLTAAHCVASNIAQNGYSIFERLTVQVGSNRIGYNGHVHSVRRIAYRSDFKNLTAAAAYGNVIQKDVAVITLSHRVVHKNARVVEVGWDYLRVPLGVDVKIAGFGKLSANGPASSYLVKTSLKTISPEYFHSLYRTQKLTDSQISARGDNTSLCEGDSGSPVIYDGKAIAVASTASCQKGEPVVLTLVAPYADFIRRTMMGRSNGYWDTYEINVTDLKNPRLTYLDKSTKTIFFKPAVQYVR